MLFRTGLNSNRILTSLLVLIVSAVGMRVSAAADAGSSHVPDVIAQVVPTQLPPDAPPEPLERATLYKAAGAVGSALLITFLCWYVAYPTMLRKGTIWPVSLFGRCTAVAWLLSWAVALALFWDKLTIAPTPFWKKDGLRILGVVIAVGFAAVWWRIWRSQKQPSK